VTYDGEFTHVFRTIRDRLRVEQAKEKDSVSPLVWPRVVPCH
jgi:hypothetical protein